MAANYNTSNGWAADFILDHENKILVREDIWWFRPPQIILIEKTRVQGQAMRQGCLPENNI